MKRISVLKDKKHRWSGAMAGDFNIGYEAEIILGKELNYGEVFAYLFRRFGYPSSGWDDYKQLTHYYIQTKMDGVALIVEPSLDTSLCFGHLLREDVQEKVRDENIRPYLEWTERFKKWSDEQGMPFSQSGVVDVNEPLFLKWCDDNKISLKNPEQQKGFYVRNKEKEKKFRKVSKEEFTKTWNNDVFTKKDYGGIPAPDDFGCWFGDNYVYSVEDEDEKYVMEFYDKWGALDWDTAINQQKKYLLIEDMPNTEEYVDGRIIFPENSFREKINNCLIDCIKDLLRPVQIRDWYINIKGRVEDMREDNGKYVSIPIKKEVKRYKYAGYPIDVIRWEKEKNKQQKKNEC